MKSKMLMTILILIAFEITLGSCTRQSELEGSWEGCNIRRPLIGWTLNIKGDRFRLVREDLNEWYTGFFRLNKNCRLKKIDLNIVDAAEQKMNGKMSLGIYEVDGGTLTIISTKPGDHLRPISFDEPSKFTEFYFYRNNYPN